jgi:hypothetical protein
VEFFMERVQDIAQPHAALPALHFAETGALDRCMNDVADGGTANQVFGGHGHLLSVAEGQRRETVIRIRRVDPGKSGLDDIQPRRVGISVAVQA